MAGSRLLAWIEKLVKSAVKHLPSGSIRSSKNAPLFFVFMLIFYQTPHNQTFVFSIFSKNSLALASGLCDYRGQSVENTRLLEVFTDASARSAPGFACGT